jgi:hypothetical protein
MSYESLKNLQLVLARLTQDKATLDTVMSGGSSALKDVCKKNGIDLDDAQAAEAFDQIKKMVAAAETLDTPGGACGIDMSKW